MVAYPNSQEIVMATRTPGSLARVWGGSVERPWPGAAVPGINNFDSKRLLVRGVELPFVFSCFQQ